MVFGSWRTFLFVLVFAFSVAAQTESVRVKVVSIYDGDTLTVADATKATFKIRIIGIDAPELKQDHGEKSRKILKRLLNADKKNIVVKTYALDRNNRILAQIFVGETDTGLELLKSGAAWIYESRDLSKNSLDAYRAAMNEAREKRRGLWEEDEAISPKDFRKKKKP